MSTTATLHAHTGHELFNHGAYHVVVIEFLNDDMTDPVSARELAGELNRWFSPNRFSTSSSTSRASERWGVQRTARSCRLFARRSRCGSATSMTTFDSRLTS